MILSVHQPQYIPWLGYFDKIAKSDCFVFLDRVQYKAREFQNRNKVRTKDGCLWLTVPVCCKGRSRQAIDACLIDNEIPWPRQHLNSLRTWYHHAPYFDAIFAFFENTYSRKWVRLIELNIHIIDYILKFLSIRTPVYLESQLGVTRTKTDRIIDICKQMKADTYLSGTGGREYLEEGKFRENGIKLIYQEFHHPCYHQQFMTGENDFIPCMSIIDLLFNAGPGSREILGLKG